MTAYNRATNNTSLQDTPDSDVLYEKAVALMQSNQSDSISDLQRHLRIGYNRAIKLRDQARGNGALEGIESYTPSVKIDACIVELPDSPCQALIQIDTYKSPEGSPLTTTSVPMPLEAAQSILDLFNKAHTTQPDYEAIEAILAKAGRVFWATARSSISKSIRTACSEVGTETVTQSNGRVINGVISILTNSREGKLSSVVTAANEINNQFPSKATKTIAICSGCIPADQIQIQVLVTCL